MRRHEGLVAAYLERLEREAEELYRRFPGGLDTIYLGGGTPSMLHDGELERIAGILAAAWGWPARLETTLEADPLTFDRRRLDFFANLGFNRLSIGVQSTQDEVLSFLGRRHHADEGLAAVAMALEAGFNTSADIITGIRGQDAARDLHTLARTGVQHLSAYGLTIEPYTSFAVRGVAVDPEKDADDFELTRLILGDYGYRRYEISNYARPGYASQHNRTYWRGDFFLALGPAAAAFEPADERLLGEGYLGVRRRNPPIKGWLLDRAPELLPVSADDYVLDVIMTGLRTRRGVDLVTLEKRSGILVTDRYQELIREASEHGLLRMNGRFLQASDEGLAKLNGLLRRFFAAGANAVGTGEGN